MPPIDSPSNIATTAFNSLQKFCRSESATSRNQRDQRALQYESLEDRCVLSASGLDLTVDPGLPPESQLVSTESFPANENGSNDQNQLNEQTAITSVTVRVNQQLFKMPAYGGALNLNMGDEFEVVSIAFDSIATQGVFATEGYVNKIQDKVSASLIDYNDGRFSTIPDNFAATGSGGEVQGLAGSWVAESGWDRLTLTLMHYQENEVTVAARSQIQLRVGEPDFVFDEQALDKLRYAELQVGEPFPIYGAWTNQGSGNFHNYAEVDIYHVSDRTRIVWAGALAGNADAENRVEGYFVNTRANDGFEEVFTPQQEGRYLFRFYLDPEKVVQETSETNNTFDVYVNVQPSNSAPVAVDDVVETSVNRTLDRLDVLANDLDPDEDAVRFAELQQPEHGRVAVNEDGTLSYTPDKGFTGADQFRYSITDGQYVSDEAVVSITVVPDKFSVEAVAAGNEDDSIRLRIEADHKQFTHVRISNLPAGAELNRGELRSDGSYEVKVPHLNQLKLTPPANSDADFTLSVTPIDGDVVWHQLTETIDVQVNAVVDGGFFDVANFAIVNGASGPLPYDFGFEDTDGSEQHTVTLSGLPDFISLSAGERVGGDWVLDLDDLVDLQIRADYVSDFSGFSETNLGFYRRFDVKVVVRSVETASGEWLENEDSFTFVAFQRNRS